MCVCVFCRYYADVVVYPYPSPRIMACKESLDASRQALAIETLEDSQRDLIVYVSREGEMNRRISNEEELLHTLERVFPDEKIVKYNSESDVDAIIALFQRAKLVIGPHGAGFSHILFTAPGTKVANICKLKKKGPWAVLHGKQSTVRAWKSIQATNQARALSLSAFLLRLQILELHFLKDPPMMFWHMAGALDLDYWIIPVPKSHWTIAEMEAPIEEVVAVVAKALDYDTSKSTPTSECTAGLVPVAVKGSVTCKACPSGKALRGQWPVVAGLCLFLSVSVRPCLIYHIYMYVLLCDTGTFKALESDPFCSPCPAGQVSPSGATYCTMCPIHHYQTSESSCEKCPDGLSTWTPGASSVSDCITQEKQDELLKV